MIYFRIAGARLHLGFAVVFEITLPSLPYVCAVGRNVIDWSKGWAHAQGGDVKICEHVSQAKDLQPSKRVCEECAQMGDRWVHLRICLTCGHIGCCDSSKNKHATKHFHGMHHPVMKSIEPGESWGWCYVDEITYDLSRGVEHAVILG